MSLKIRTSVKKNGNIFKYRFLISVFLIFCVGIILGSAVISSSAKSEKSFLISILNESFSSLNNKSIFGLFFYFLVNELIILLFIFIFGLSNMPKPIYGAVFLFYGIYKSVMPCYLFLKNGISSILKFTLIFAPIWSVASLLIFNFCLISANMKFEIEWEGENDIYRHNIKQYKKKFALYTLFVAIISFLYSLLICQIKF